LLKALGLPFTTKGIGFSVAVGVKVGVAVGVALGLIVGVDVFVHVTVGLGVKLTIPVGVGVTFTNGPTWFKPKTQKNKIKMTADKTTYRKIFHRGEGFRCAMLWILTGPSAGRLRFTGGTYFLEAIVI